MAFRLKYQVTPRYLPTPSKRRSGLPMSPGARFIVAHDTGNPRSTAANNVAYYIRSSQQISASAHLFVDDREILECVPALTAAPEKAWHVMYSKPTDNQLFGFDANDAAVAVEYCYGDNIDADRAYDKYVWVTAYACHRFGLDPARSVVGHFFLDPQRRTDPVTGLAHSRRTYEQFLRDVVTESFDCLGEPPPVADETAPIPLPARFQTTVRLNVRVGRPSTRAPVHQVLAVGAEVEAVAAAPDGEPVNGISLWYGDANGNYFWSGGVQPA